MYDSRAMNIEYMDDRRGYQVNPPMMDHRSYDGTTYGDRNDYRSYGNDRNDYRSYNDRASYGNDNRRRDYGREDNLEVWKHRLMKEIDEKGKQMFRMDSFIKRAEDMGIRFDRFSPEELHVTAVMLYSDFAEALGNMPVDIYIKMAKAWLCDPDAAVRYGDKLEAYQKHIVQVF